MDEQTDEWYEWCGIHNRMYPESEGCVACDEGWDVISDERHDEHVQEILDSKQPGTK